jgi:hypothetical protein
VAEKADGRLHEGNGSGISRRRWACDRHAETAVCKQNGTGNTRRSASGDGNIISVDLPWHDGLLGSRFQ